VDYSAFYGRLFAPLQAISGPIDRDTIAAIVGFDGGGPLNFCTIGRESGRRFVIYFSCELAVRPGQQPSDFGRYELLTSCDDERWVRSVLSEIGRMSLEVAFGHGHTLDIGSWVDPAAPIQGVVFEKLCTAEIDGKNYGILRCIGISRREMRYAQRWGSAKLFARLKKAGLYPHTAIHRQCTP
jgi:hypothetical protein